MLPMELRLTGSGTSSLERTDSSPLKLPDPSFLWALRASLAPSGSSSLKLPEGLTRVLDGLLRGSSYFKLPETLLKVSEGLLERGIRKLLETLLLEVLNLELAGESCAMPSSGRTFEGPSRGSSRRLLLAALRG